MDGPEATSRGSPEPVGSGPSDGPDACCTPGPGKSPAPPETSSAVPAREAPCPEDSADSSEDCAESSEDGTLRTAGRDTTLAAIAAACAHAPVSNSSPESRKAIRWAIRSHRSCIAIAEWVSPCLGRGHKLSRIVLARACRSATQSAESALNARSASRNSSLHRRCRVAMSVSVTSAGWAGRVAPDRAASRCRSTAATADAASPALS